MLKPNNQPFSGDTRESAAIYISRHLLDEGAQLSIYDPKVTQAQIFMDLFHASLGSDSWERSMVSCHQDPYSAAADGNI